MRISERLYYEMRAEQELEQAELASDPCAVRAHYQLAELYLDRIFARPTAVSARDNDRSTPPTMRVKRKNREKPNSAALASLPSAPCGSLEPAMISPMSQSSRDSGY